MGAIRRSTMRGVRSYRSFIVLSKVRAELSAQIRAVAGAGIQTSDKMVHFVQKPRYPRLLSILSPVQKAPVLGRK